MSCKQVHIVGMVGAGKSSLSKLLSVREDITLFPEPVSSNPYLEKFYENPKGFAFPMQTFLLLSRYKQAIAAQQLDRCIMDMSIYGNDIFSYLMHANGDMSDDDYQTYVNLANTFKDLLKPPTLMVYLECSTEVAVQRIIRRGRPSELKASIDYWFNLNKCYERWFDEYSFGKKILINVDKLNFVSEDDDEDYILDIIMEEFNNA
jgi:deoxyadenosine/deoxycytidine kinase